MGSGAVSLTAWKPGAWKTTAWRAGAWESSGAEPETPPTFGSGSRPRRDARKPRNDDDALLILVLL